MKGKLAAAGVLALAIPVVAYFEGFIPHTYADPVGIPTICYGYAGPDVPRDALASRPQCEALLTVEVWETYQGVMRCVRRELAPHEAAALTSWAYNVGTGAACGSTLMRRLNAGEPAVAWCAELDRWVFAKGQRLPGLVKRRAAERALCEGRQ